MSDETRLVCVRCGMLGNVDPWLHAERYGHEPIVMIDGKRCVHRGDGTFRPEDVTDEMEDAAWRDAYYIADVGACNPRAVARTLTQHREVLGDSHPAVMAIAGHLAFLHKESLGPEAPILDAVRENAIRLGLHSG